MKSLLPTLALQLLALVLIAPAARAQYGYAADSRVRPVHKRQHVPPHIRARAGGWEVRSRHFVVFSPNSAGEATRLAREVETAWSDMSNLADHWMTAHRNPRFGLASINVRVLPRGKETVKVNRPREIFLSHDPNAFDSKDRVVELRRASIRAFLSVSEMDLVLPEWLQEGLTSYVVGESGARTVEDQSKSAEPNAVWVRAMLEADDGRYVWKLFGAMQHTMVDGNGAALTRLARDVDLPQLASDWSENPLAGQPILKAPKALDEETVAVVADMFDLLKLERRYRASQAKPIRSHVVGVGLLPSDPLAMTQASATWSLRHVQEQLLAPQAPRWATIDARGKLVTSRDRTEIESLFQRAARRLVPIIDSDRRLLRSVLHDGRIVEGWLAENRDDPSRPSLNIQVRQPISEGQSEPATKKPESGKS